MTDRRVLRMAPGASAAGATLYLGLYDYQNGQRLAAADATGARLAGDAVSLALPVPVDGACR
jgi:hypothetical protein